MRVLLSLILALVVVSIAHADCWKITSRGHHNVWAVDSTCANGACSNSQCQPASKPSPQVLPEAPAQTAAVSGSCANGSCGVATQPRGLLRRWR